MYQISHQIATTKSLRSSTQHTFNGIPLKSKTFPFDKITTLVCGVSYLMLRRQARNYNREAYLSLTQRYLLVELFMEHS